MKRSNILKLLGHEMAQADRRFRDYCVKRTSLLSNLRDEEFPFLIINAPRGMGKSGLLLNHADDISHTYPSNSKVISKYSSDIQFPPKDDVSIGQYVNFWKNTILSWIVEQIGLDSKFCITDDDMTALELAEAKGLKKVDIVGSLLKRLRFKGMPIEKLQFDSELKEHQLFRIITASGVYFWILLDEMDDNYNNTPAINNSLVALFQACNHIAQHCPKVMIRVTIRPHIMTILRTNYDIVQKFKSQEITIDWTKDEFVELLARRVDNYEDLTKGLQMELLSDTREIDLTRRKLEAVAKYFEDFDLSFGEGHSSEYRALYTIALGRPRWLVEFCTIALTHAQLDYADLSAFKKAMYDYGHNRIQFLAGEHRFHMPYLDRIINQLSGLRKVNLGKSSDLENYIKFNIVNNELVPNYFEPKRPREEQVREVCRRIASELFMVEFLRAKQKLGGRDNHRFYTFVDRPSLLSSWSDEKNIEWHVHPTFTRGLNIEDSQVYKVGQEIRELGSNKPGRRNSPRGKANPRKG